MPEASPPLQAAGGEVVIRQYLSEEDLPLVMHLIDHDLSEPYSIFTYRYFLHNWPQLCFLAMVGDTCVGTVVGKMDQHRHFFRGYIAMLVVDKPYRSKGMGTVLVRKCVEVMQLEGCEEVTLEAEVTNKGALALYQNLGFVRDKRLHRYYLNGVDAFRLKLLFPYRPPREGEVDEFGEGEDGLGSLHLDYKDQTLEGL
eukprot:jgi/Mesvir1/24008/Mv10754-RA.1